MAIDSKKPLVFDLEDGDHVELCTWAYIVYQLSDPIAQITLALDSINEQLQRIDEKLQSWIEDE